MAMRRVLNGLGAILAFAACLSAAAAAPAADFGFGPVDLGFPVIGLEHAPLSLEEAPESVGVPCMIGASPWAPPITAKMLPWPSVWLGHFSGGRPDPVFYGHIDWRDEKVCFASKARCQTWIKDLRRAFHRPEGYWTCLLLR